MTEVIKLAEADEFWAVRGKAIQSYANLEQALFGLFANLSAMPRDAAAIVLFKIASADARNKILEKLFRRKFGQGFNLFRNSLFDQLRPIDQERNEIVHWNAAVKMGHDGAKETATMLLVPPAFTPDPHLPQKGAAAVRAFDLKCGFYTRLVNMFTLVECDAAADPKPAAGKLPWQHIFSQPIAYPPPGDHPLSPNPPALESHVQAFLV